ncbi:MAG TPA: chemotaxis protein CheB [Ktedonobacterales bacterium]|nr:chemotaxis protein CheB [Ktedonobacterales bacterium]
MGNVNGQPPRTARQHHDIVVVGASTGGVEALSALVQRLPGDLPAAVFVVLHLSPQAPSHLPEILGRHSRLPVHHPRDGEPVQLGHIYVAVPDRHLLVERGLVRVVRGPRENRHRPAVDPLFRTAALAYGPRAIGVVLTGALDDGTAGLYSIKQRGGLAVVQDPRDALIASMPQSALEYVAVDYCVPLLDLAPLLVRLVHEQAPSPAAYPPSRELVYESHVAQLDEGTMLNEQPPGILAALTCPECGGPLWETHNGELLRYRCRSGHAYTGESAFAARSEALDEALWAAYNALRESALMAQRLAAEARERGHQGVAARFEARAREQLRRSDAILTVVAGVSGAVPLDERASEQHLPLTAERELGETRTEAGHGSRPTRRSRSAKQPAPEGEPESEAAAEGAREAGV